MVGTNSRINQAREGDVRSRLEAQKQRVLQLKQQRDEMGVLQREEVDSAQKAYDLVMARLTQTSLESKSRQGNVAVLSVAVPPTEGGQPKLLLNLVSPSSSAGCWHGVASCANCSTAASVAPPIWRCHRRAAAGRDPPPAGQAPTRARACVGPAAGLRSNHGHETVFPVIPQVSAFENRRSPSQSGRNPGPPAACRPTRWPVSRPVSGSGDSLRCGSHRTRTGDPGRRARRPVAAVRLPGARAGDQGADPSWWPPSIPPRPRRRPCAKLRSQLVLRRMSQPLLRTVAIGRRGAR